MNLSIVFLATLLSLQCSWAYRTYYIEDECNSPRKYQKVFYRFPGSGPDSVGELRSNRFGTYARTGRKCLVKLIPPEGFGLVVTVLKVDFRNHEGCQDYIKIYDDDNEDGEKLCGYQERGFSSRTFYSDDRIEMLYHTEEGGMGFNDGFRLIFTVVKRGNFSSCSSSSEFRCSNSRCIWVGVTCDGFNNCGDGSDELTTKHPHCPRITPIAIAAVVLAITSFVAIVVAMCLCCCRVKPQKQKPRLEDDFPSRINGGYMPLPGYNYGTLSHNHPSANSPPYPQCHGYSGGIPFVQQKVEIRYDRPPPPYRE